MNYADLFRITLPETVLEIAALLVLVVDLGFLRKAAMNVRLAVAAALGVVGCGVALIAVVLQGASWLTYGTGSDSTLLATGGFIAVAQAGILVLTALTLLLLFDSMFTRNIGEFVAVVLMAAAGGMLIAGAQDLLVIFIGLELLSLGLYILTAFAKSSGKSAEAAMKYYLFGGMSAAFLLFGFSYLYGLTGTTNLALIQYRITLAGPSPLFYVAWVLVIAGLGFKIAAVPFHLWAPDTYEGAPAPAAAFVASVSKVASFALLITLAMNWWLRPSGNLTAGGFPLEQVLRAYYQTWPQVATILLIAAAASMVVGNLAALAQSSVRRLLAYSAIAHAGYMLLGLAAHPVFTGKGSAVAFNSDSFFTTLRSMESVLFYVLTYGLTTVGALARSPWSSALRAATAWTPSSACTSATRFWPPCCWCCFCRLRAFRRWSASGPSSTCLRRFLANMRGRRRLRSCVSPSP